MDRCDVEEQLAQDSDTVFPRFNLAFVLGASQAELQRQGGSGVKAGVVDSVGDGEVFETSLRLTAQLSCWFAAEARSHQTVTTKR